MLHLEHPVSSSAPADGRPMRNRAVRSNGKSLFRLPKLSRVAAILGVFALAMPASAATVTRADQQLYAKGCWGAYAQPWGAGALKRGVDYADTITISEGAFPASTSIAWYWPTKTPTGVGVYGYAALGLGDYDGGPVQGCFKPRQVKAVGTLKLAYSTSWSTALGDFNLVGELYAYEGPTSASAKKLEAGFLARASAAAIAYAKAGVPVGTFTDAAGVKWTVSRQGSYVMFVPPAAIATGTLDFGGALAFLRAKGLLIGEEWVTGLGFGVEPVSGAGFLWVNQLAVDGL
jgi:hypothetical protein